MKKKSQFLWSLLKHKWFVLIAGVFFRRKLGIGIPLGTLILHDWSKFTQFQFQAYTDQFFGGGSDQFQAAFKEHYTVEPHHPEAWILDDPPDFRCRMHGLALREMIIDWMGSGRTYTGSWNMQEWLNQNLYKKPLSPGTLVRVKEIVTALGYVV